MVNNKLFRTVDGGYILLEFHELREQWEYYLMTYNADNKPVNWVRAGNQEFQKWLCERKQYATHIANNIRYYK